MEKIKKALSAWSTGKGGVHGSPTVLTVKVSILKTNEGVQRQEKVWCKEETVDGGSRMKFKPFGKIPNKKIGDKSTNTKKEVFDDKIWKKKSIFYELEYCKNLPIH